MPDARKASISPHFVSIHDVVIRLISGVATRMGTFSTQSEGLKWKDVGPLPAQRMAMGPNRRLWTLRVRSSQERGEMTPPFVEATPQEKMDVSSALGLTVTFYPRENRPVSEAQTGWQRTVPDRVEPCRTVSDGN
jgi:hypothetical protein